MAQTKAKLDIKIPKTNEEFIYELFGFGEEPISKGNITLDCRARKPKDYTLRVTNPYKNRKL